MCVGGVHSVFLIIPLEWGWPKLQHLNLPMYTRLRCDMKETYDKLHAIFKPFSFSLSVLVSHSLSLSFFLSWFHILSLFLSFSFSSCIFFTQKSFCLPFFLFSGTWFHTLSLALSHPLISSTPFWTKEEIENNLKLSSYNCCLSKCIFRCGFLVQFDVRQICAFLCYVLFIEAFSF